MPDPPGRAERRDDRDLAKKHDSHRNRKCLSTLHAEGVRIVAMSSIPTRGGASVEVLSRR